MSPLESSVETASESVATRVVTAVASRKGVDPTAIEQPLYHAVDPDALEALVASGSGADLQVTFDYSGYVVSVDASGRVSVSVDGAGTATATETATD